MGVMSQLAAEKDEEINALHWEYREAFAAMMEYLETLHPLNRTAAQTEKLSRLTSLCDMAKYKYDTAEMRRYTI